MPSPNSRRSARFDAYRHAQPAAVLRVVGERFEHAGRVEGHVDSDHDGLDVGATPQELAFREHVIGNPAIVLNREHRDHRVDGGAVAAVPAEVAVDPHGDEVGGAQRGEVGRQRWGRHVEVVGDLADRELVVPGQPQDLAADRRRQSVEDALHPITVHARQRCT